MIKQLVGGAVVLVIGGTTVAVNNADIAKNFSNNTGMSQEQSEQYVNNVKESDLESFTKIGESFISEGNSLQTEVTSIDCVNYTYGWETPSLSCSDGKNQLQKLGNDAVTLGHCYQTLDTDLGNSAKAKTRECIVDIDVVNADYDFPIAAALLDTTTITESKKTNIYNKSLLQAALQSN